MKIAINIGHTPTDPGAIDGLDAKANDFRYSREESDNNRFGGFVCSRLIHAGYEVKIFEQGISEPFKALGNRILAWQPDLFFSLHRNAAPSAPAARGWSVWYHGSSCDSKKLAGMLAEELKSFPDIRPDPVNCLRNDFEIYPRTDTYPGGFAVLIHTNLVPGCLFEGGFLTNPMDETWYDNAQILDNMARAVALTVKDWRLNR